MDTVYYILPSGSPRGGAGPLFASAPGAPQPLPCFAPPGRTASQPFGLANPTYARHAPPQMAPAAAQAPLVFLDSLPMATPQPAPGDLLIYTPLPAGAQPPLDADPLLGLGLFDSPQLPSLDYGGLPDARSLLGLDHLQSPLQSPSTPQLGMMPLLDRPATAPASPNRTRSGRRKASTSSSSTSPALAPGTLPGPVAPMPRRHRGATKQPDDIPPHLLVTAARTLFSKDPLLLTGDELAACASWVLQRRAQNTEYARRHRGKAKRKQEELEARAQALEEENRRLKARLGRNRRRWKEDGYATD